METKKYYNIFSPFDKTPMKEFIKTIFKGITSDMRKQLVLEDVSYHQLNADVSTLEAWMYIAPVESNQWIWVRVEKDATTGSIQEEFYTKDSYRKESLHSLQACMDFYQKTEK